MKKKNSHSRPSVALCEKYCEFQVDIRKDIFIISLTFFFSFIVVKIPYSKKMKIN